MQRARGFGDNPTHCSSIDVVMVRIDDSDCGCGGGGDANIICGGGGDDVYATYSSGVVAIVTSIRARLALSTD